MFSAVSKGHYGSILEIRGERREIEDRERIYQLTVITTMQLRSDAYRTKAMPEGTERRKWRLIYLIALCNQFHIGRKVMKYTD